MADLIDKIRTILGEKSSTRETGENEMLDPEAVKQLMHILQHTQDEEMTCEEVANCLDEYVDCLAGRMAAGDLISAMERHLLVCSDCREAYMALLRTIEASESAE